MKKLFFTLCALCLCGTMWGQDVYQDTQYGLYYEVNEDGTSVTIVEPTDGSVYSNANLVAVDDTTHTFPAKIDEYDLTRIGASAFDNSEISGKLVIPNTILNLCGLAFNECTGLTQVNFDYGTSVLKDENTTAYASSFNGCDNVKIVVLERDIEAATSGAVSPFAYVNGIYTVYIGEYVTKIPSYMFRSNTTGYKLKTVISDAETPPSIDSSVFDHHSTSSFNFYTQYDYLNNYRLDDTWLTVFGGDNMHAYDSDTDPDWPEDVNAFQDENGLWYDPIEDTEYECVLIADQGGEVYSGEITIPETVYNNNDGNTYTVTRIDANAFANSSIEGEVVIPANILNMGKQAFYNCTGIKTVTYEYSPTPLYEENTTNNSDGSFQGCNQITTVNIYRDITLYGNNLYGPFVGLGTVQTINIGPRVTSIPTYMFRNSSAQTATTAINCYAAVPPTLGTGPFGVLSTSCVAYVPQGSETAYQASSWNTQYESLSYSTLSNAYAVTISELAELDGSYYATYYNDNAVDIYPQGGTLSDGSVYDVTTYAATGVDVEENTAYLELVEVGATVPAGVAVLVDGNVAGTYTVIETTAAQTASYSGTNDLYGFVYDEETEEYVAVAPDAGSYYFYKLTLDSDNDSNSLGFYWGAEEGGTFTGEANKAYLVLTQGALQGLSAVKLKKGEGEDTTGITSVEVENETNTVKGIYTVQGIRVSNMNQPGLYIVDGKKVLVK